MPTVTQAQTAASFVIDGTEYNCQIINFSYSPTSTGTGETVEVACPDGGVVVPGELEYGSASGEVFADTTDTGITWALASAQANDEIVAYEFTFFSDQGATVAMKYTGDCKVQNFTIDWEGKSYARHPIDLVILSDNGPERPA